MKETISQMQQPSFKEIKPPLHVAIIMDGNRRWARQKNLPSVVGHWQGAQALFNAVETAVAMGIKTLTVFTFSTENWNRSPQEVEVIMKLLQIQLSHKRAKMVQAGIRLQTIGDLTRLSQKVQNSLHEIKLATQQGTVMDLVLAINYGARDDIKRAVIAMMIDHQQGKLNIEEVSEAVIGQYLDTAAWQDPDLIIRTSGENRLSNFLLWQGSYSELYMTKVLWPDFGKEHFQEAISEFHKRNRRIGC